ncbi:MAG TPA: PPC domain-containing protein, partial [Candidatus Acidoferrales bacterium]|nr:PPC domain-containing protein [Candidatus Acidoferrales bacterium]
MKLCLGLALGALCAAQPVITDLQPRGVQKGRPFTLTLIGRDLGEGARIESTLPATFTPLGPEKGVMGASFLVELTGDPAVDVYPVRVVTPQGISNVQLFSIGAFPEYTEEESRRGALPNSNDTIETAQALPSGPLTMNGKLAGPERDVYRLSAKAGERRVIEVEARRCGSAIDPEIELEDPSGKVLARSEDAPLIGLDARLDFTFPRDGYYYVVLHDARYSTQAANFYRLKIGMYDYPREVFPLGGHRGETVQVSLGSQKITADLRNTPPDVRQIFIHAP